MSAIVEQLVERLQATRGVGQRRPSEEGLSLGEAYRVAHRLARRQPAPPVGRKVGLSNRASWQQLGLSDIVWGYLFAETVREAPDNSVELSLEGLAQPRLEPEIVFGLKAPLPSGTRDPVQLLASVAWLALGFEVVVCPYPNWQFAPADLVATFGFHGALIVGERRPLEDPAAVAAQLAVAEARLYRNGELLLSGGGANVLGNPAVALGHLADLIAADREALPLAAGELITSGTLTAAPDIAPGERYRAEVRGLGLPPLMLQLTA